ncbi:MAG: class I SAM-dependent methyltransferase [Candidatus Hodarchaeota archaeon]
MIDWKKRLKTELPFFREILGHQSSILDLACGVGRHAFEFAKWGHRVKGIDIDPQMIEKATQHARSHHIEHLTTFEIGSFEDILKGKDFGDFTHIVCIGNSLSLIQQKEDLDPLMHRLASYLRSGGQLVLQILNYDGLETKLPYHKLVNNTSGFFLRIYEAINCHQIRFTLAPVLRSSKGHWKSYNPVESFLWKISANELITLLRINGFIKIKLYGSYSKTEFSTDSAYLLLVATLK